MRFAYGLALLVATAVPAATSAITPVWALELSLPIACEPGATCMVQSLVDADPGPGRRDAFCGAATYDGHKGTDFRVADVAAQKRGVDVLAPAPGRVTAVRDGEPDRMDPASVRDGRDCGNGVVIDHGGGWTTQLCHLARDSVRVAKGARVERGQTIGRVGLSGRTEFPHVHMTVRREGRVVDPTSGAVVEEAGVQACASAGTDASLWDARARAAVRGDRTVAVGAGFSGGAVEGRDVTRSRVAKPGKDGPLVFWVQFTNVEAGDRLEIAVDGFREPVRSASVLEKPQALRTAFAGRRRAGPGRYEGRARLVRDGAVVAEAERAWVRE